MKFSRVYTKEQYDVSDLSEDVERIIDLSKDSNIFSSDEDRDVFCDEFCYIAKNKIAVMDDKRSVDSFDVHQKNVLERIKILGKQMSLDGIEDKISITIPIDHVESRKFLKWKQQSDVDNIAINIGSDKIQKAGNYIIDACDRDSFFGFDPKRNEELKSAVEYIRSAGINDEIINRAISYAEQGYEEFPIYKSQNIYLAEEMINISVSLHDEFIEAALTDHSFTLYDRGEEVKSESAYDTWGELLESVWTNGEPTICFKDNIGAFNYTDKVFDVNNSGGFVFIPDSIAPAASINLLAFKCNDNVVDVDRLIHVTRIMTIALELMSDDNNYNPIMLSVTNIAALLMANGLAYDSDEGRSTSAIVTALFSGAAYKTSSELASILGSFNNYNDDEEKYLQYIKNKQMALVGKTFIQKGILRKFIDVNLNLCPDKNLVNKTKEIWENIYSMCRDSGLRHAHITAIDTSLGAQIALDAQAQNINPVSSLIVFEEHGGYSKGLNPIVNSALKKLGYTTSQIEDINFYIIGNGTLLDAPCINHKTLRDKGFDYEQIAALEVAVSNSRHINYAFNQWVLGDKFNPDDLNFTEDEIEKANLYACGAMTIEGAPHLKLEHLQVFDCISPDTLLGVRKVSYEAQIKMLASLEKFLSGGVSHILQLNHHSSIDEIKDLLLLAWETGVKRIKFYRDCCSLLSPVMIDVDGFSMSVETNNEDKNNNDKENEECQKQYTNV